MSERFMDLLETIFVKEGRLQNSYFNEEIPEREETVRETNVPKANTADQLFHRYSSDLAIGGKPL